MNLTYVDELKAPFVEFTIIPEKIDHMNKL